MNTRIIITLLLFSQLAFGQETPPTTSNASMALDFCFINFPMMKRNYSGINLDMKFFSDRKFMAGFTFNYVQGKVTKDLNYSFTEPILNHYEGGITVQYGLIRNPNAYISTSFSTGLIWNVYGDDATRDELTQELLDKVTTTQFYIAPGAEFNFRLFPNMTAPQIYFTAKLKYLLPFGYPRFGAPSDFSGYYIGAGVTLIGLIAE